MANLKKIPTLSMSYWDFHLFQFHCTVTCLESSLVSGNKRRPSGPPSWLIGTSGSGRIWLAFPAISFCSWTAGKILRIIFLSLNLELLRTCEGDVVFQSDVGSVVLTNWIKSFSENCSALSVLLATLCEVTLTSMSMAVCK